MGNWAWGTLLLGFQRYRVSIDGVGATAFPRQLVLLKKNYCIGMRGPQKPMYEGAIALHAMPVPRSG
ncbi:MAG: hypothetical protein F6J93_20720 [Oscillatoria sp. SIO1A7]|nr:hypothetical protein [Oscillatoria sp. SIO1A7]